ncbi:hypothetical protein MTP99_015334 [Tenebrio molitor]|nr:hypothetical protein MTP99_015334 [Tenebrio molitor]
MPPTYALLIAFLLVVCLFFKHFGKLMVCAAQLKGPFAYPLVGNGLKFICKKEDFLNVILNLVSPYQSPTRFWMGPRLVVAVKDPNQLQIVLQSSKITTKGFFYRFLEPFLGKGLFTSSGITHKTHRKLLQPLFSQRMIEGYCHLFQKHAAKFVERMRPHAGGPEFDVMLYLQDSAFENTMDVLLEDKNEHSIDYKDVPQFIKRFYNIAFTRFRYVWLHWNYLFQKSSLFKDQAYMKTIASTMIEEIMYKRLPEIIERIKNNKMSTSDDLRVPSMLEQIAVMIYNDPNCLTIQNCIDHLMTLMATGQDTYSTTVAFTCMMLGAHPDIQNLAVKELRDVVGDKKSLDMDDVSKLKYLEMCIKETLRLFPVAPFVLRETTEDFQLGKITIPKNVTVLIGIYFVHRDPTLWERPNEFYPDHFQPEAVSKRHPYAYIPFSAGPRRCIAQQYSYTQLKVTLGTLLLHYELECQRKVEDIKLTSDISVRPLCGYLIKIKERV